jgi:hypothetical protein
LHWEGGRSNQQAAGDGRCPYPLAQNAIINLDESTEG